MRQERKNSIEVYKAISRELRCRAVELSPDAVKDTIRRQLAYLCKNSPDTFEVLAGLDVVDYIDHWCSTIDAQLQISGIFRNCTSIELEKIISTR